jgi:hypothetical protein
MKKAAHVLQLEVVLLEPRVKAPLQTNRALDHNASDDTDDDTLTHCILQIANPSFTKTLTGTVPYTSQNIGGNMGALISCQHRTSGGQQVLSLYK